LSEQKQGYIYRSAGLTDTALAALLAAVFGEQAKVWTFGLNSIHLQPITQQPISTKLVADSKHGPLSAGHAFTAAAEVRWKHRDGTYDALVLTEDTQLATRLTATTLIAEYEAHYPPTPEAHLVLATPRDVLERKHEWRMGYVEYWERGSTAVQLIRYTERIERPRRQS
jgi:hypothetical protein